MTWIQSRDGGTSSSTRRKTTRSNTHTKSRVFDSKKQKFVFTNKYRRIQEKQREEQKIREGLIRDYKKIIRHNPNKYEGIAHIITQMAPRKNTFKNSNNRDAFDKLQAHLGKIHNTRRRSKKTVTT